MAKISGNALDELVNAGIITTDTADSIRAYYRGKSHQTQNRLFLAFGILGALLVGLGIILIIAHNWDDLPRTIKTGLAFLPLVFSQLFCGYVLWKKAGERTFRESAATLLFLSVGACISLISQIYHIPGNLGNFLLTWMVLCLPLIYVMRSSTASLLYIMGITWYVCEVCYWGYPRKESYWYWLLLAAAIPHYYLLIKQQTSRNFLHFHHWFLPLSVIISLGTLATDQEHWMVWAYFSLCCSLYLIGGLPYFEDRKLWSNGYLVLGSLGMLIMLLIFSFEEFWEDLVKEKWEGMETLLSPDFIVMTQVLTMTAGLFYYRNKVRSTSSFDPVDLLFIVFGIIFLSGLVSVPIPIILVNLLVLGLGVHYTRKGALNDHLGVLNYGLIIITSLIACRFFDTDLSFVLRGVMFVVVGLGFFGVNYYMLQKRKQMSDGV